MSYRSYDEGDNRNDDHYNSNDNRGTVYNDNNYNSNINDDKYGNDDSD